MRLSLRIVSYSILILLYCIGYLAPGAPAGAAVGCVLVARYVDAGAGGPEDAGEPADCERVR